MKQNLKNNTAKFVYIILLLAVGINCIQQPKLIVVQVFAAIYLTVIFKCFSTTFRKNLYYATLMFAIMGYAMMFHIGERYGIYYFYFTLFIYMVLLIFKEKCYIKVVDIVKNNKYARFLCIFIIYFLISIIWTDDKKVAIMSSINYIIMISLLLMVVMENNSRDKLRETFKFLEYVYLGILVLGFVQILGFKYGLKNSYDVVPHIYEKLPYLKRVPQVFFYNPNNYGVVVTVAMIFIVVAYLFSNTKKQKLYYMVLFICSQLNLIFSKCRTAWIILAMFMIFAIILSILYKSRNIRKSSTQIFVVMVIIFFVLSLVPEMTYYYDKFNATPILRKLNIVNIHKPAIPNNEIASFGEKGSINVRYTLMIDVVNGVIKEKHLLGFGVGNTPTYIKKLGNTHEIFSIHSFWFEILGDFGVFIFLYFIYICINIIKELFINLKTKNDDLNRYSLTGILSAISIAGLIFAPSSVVAFTPFWICLALIYSSLEVSKLEE
ncbi:O-antigen ligase family protein [Clostridium novyi]|uniref:O-antigen ligase family protein n=1 Tax=Clostridium novyi TaxID=1542 RepID=UPI00068DD3A5|nr:O-antigen ligase family protein [Clostridium novyi]